MPFNGSGTFSLVAGNPVVTGTVISSTVQNNTTSDFATAFTNCVTRDGQSAALANLPMGGFKHTGAAVATAANQYLTYGQALNGTTGTFAGAVTGVTDLTTTGNTILGNAQADTLNVGNGDIIKDTSGNTGFGRSPLVKVDILGVNNSTTFSSNADLRVTSNNSSVSTVYGWNQLSCTADFMFGSGLNMRFTMTTDGRLYGSALHNNATALTGATNQYIGSGTHLRDRIDPTAPATAGCWAVALQSSWFISFSGCCLEGVSPTLPRSSVRWCTWDYRKALQMPRTSVLRLSL